MADLRGFQIGVVKSRYVNLQLLFSVHFCFTFALLSFKQQVLTCVNTTRKQVPTQAHVPHGVHLKVSLLYAVGLVQYGHRGAGCVSIHCCLALLMAIVLHEEGFWPKS